MSKLWYEEISNISKSYKETNIKVEQNVGYPKMNLKGPLLKYIGYM